MSAAILQVWLEGLLMKTTQQSETISFSLVTEIHKYALDTLQPIVHAKQTTPLDIDISCQCKDNPFYLF